MVENLYLILGFALLIIVSYDFFFTTLSGSGAAFLTRLFSALAHKLQLILSKWIGRRVFSLSGMMVNLTVLAVWMLLAWIAVFLIFSSNPDAIVNNYGRTASDMERLYFTGYVLSTLGVGNFKPVTPVFELLTSLFSFFGFVFFTTSMTYLISISSAVIHKRTLALAIRNLGKTPAEVVTYLVEQDSALSYQQIGNLQQMICKHTVNHQAYPVLHNYSNPDYESSLSINLVVLDEAVSILRFSTRKSLDKALRPLENALYEFLQHIKQKYGDLADAEDIPKIDWSQAELPDELLQQSPDAVAALTDRRRILGGLLQNEGFTWQDVYSGRH